jgi:hypothetical protein
MSGPAAPTPVKVSDGLPEPQLSDDPAQRSFAERRRDLRF